MAASIKHELAGRLGLVYLIVMVIAAFIVVKALHVQIWEGDKWRKMGRSVSFKDFEVAPNRGIYMRMTGVFWRVRFLIIR